MVPAETEGSSEPTRVSEASEGDCTGHEESSPTRVAKISAHQRRLLKKLHPASVVYRKELQRKIENQDLPLDDDPTRHYWDMFTGALLVLSLSQERASKDAEMKAAWRAAKAFEGDE